MASAPPVESDPFADPDIIEEQLDFARESTLTVGRNASLTLATDSLIVLGKLTYLQLVPIRQADPTQTKASSRGRAAIAVGWYRAVSFVRTTAYDSTDSARNEANPSYSLLQHTLG